MLSHNVAQSLSASSPNLEAREFPFRRLVLNFDATDGPVHGRQEGRFFHKMPQLGTLRPR